MTISSGAIRNSRVGVVLQEGDGARRVDSGLIVRLCVGGIALLDTEKVLETCGHVGKLWFYRKEAFVTEFCHLGAREVEVGVARAALALHASARPEDLGFLFGVGRRRIVILSRDEATHLGEIWIDNETRGAGGRRVGIGGVHGSQVVVGVARLADLVLE